MSDSGSALMGIGIAAGENRAAEAAKAAINSPLLEISIDGAKGVLFNISGSNDLTMLEISEAANIITESIDPNAKVIFGAVVDEQVKKGEIVVTVVATGFDAERRTKENPLVRRASQPSQPASVTISNAYEPVVSSRDEVEKKKEEEFKEITFPVKKILKPDMIIEEKIQPRQINSSQEAKAVEEDDELEIPAFIRRKMER
jgi:cell division protein FtsZ